jgi:hypothetical protein
VQGRLVEVDLERQVAVLPGEGLGDRAVEFVVADAVAPADGGANPLDGLQTPCPDVALCAYDRYRPGVSDPQVGS